MAWQEDLETALHQVESSVLIERKDADTVRVSLPGGPGMLIRSDYFTHIEGNPIHLLSYAERIIQKLKKERGK